MKDLELTHLYEYGQCPPAQGGLLGLGLGKDRQLGGGQSSQEGPFQILKYKGTEFKRIDLTFFHVQYSCG